MINLTNFIGDKLKTVNTLSAHKHFHNDSNQQGMNQKKKPYKFQQYQNISQKSIGLSTLLDLHNEQEAFGEFDVSRIRGRSQLRYSKKESNSSYGTANVKNQIEQMRQRRKALEEKVNKTLRKEQYRAKGFAMTDTKRESRNQSLRESSKIPQEESHISESRSQHKPSIVMEQQEQSSESRQSIQSSSERGSSNVESSSIHESLRSSFQYESLDKSIPRANNHSDPFMNFLHRDMYQLKCQKFIQFVRNFQYRYLIKNMKQYVQLYNIVKREEMKICRFVFICWKRQTKQCLQKSAMIQMIKNRVKQKKSNPAMCKQTQKNKLELSQLSTSKNIQNVEPHTLVSKMIPQQVPTSQKQKSKIPNIQKSKIPTIQKEQPDLEQSIQRQSEYISLKPSQAEPSSFTEDFDQYESELNIQQVSPIKQRPSDHQLEPASNQASFYSMYSCNTQKQQEEYIK